MPAFSPDGRRVYFFAPRPGSDAAKDDESALDIWVAEKQGDGWSEPKCLNLVVRYPELRYADMPRVTRNGTLYFLGYAPDTKSNHGIYRSELVNSEYAKPELLPRSINLPPFLNWAPFIAPDESYLLFSSNRTGSLDEYGDIYISRRQLDGSWTDPVSLGEPVNTKMQEVFPGVSPDGKYLFFCRYTPGHKNDVYWVDVASIKALHFTTTPSQENPK
jgi:Tol biopolymer transport system component